MVTTLTRRRFTVDDQHKMVAAGILGEDDEVAGSSLAYERDVKAGLYVQAGVPEYWLVDLHNRVITVRRDPGPASYRTVFRVRDAEPFSPQAFPDVVLTAHQMLG